MAAKKQVLQYRRVCVCVYVSFMSTGCMYHGYDLRTGDWMMILISTGEACVLSPFDMKLTYRCVYVCVCLTACADEWQAGDSTTAKLHTSAGRSQHDAIWYKCYVRVRGIGTSSGATLHSCICDNVGEWQQDVIIIGHLRDLLALNFLLFQCCTVQWCFSFEIHFIFSF